MVLLSLNSLCEMTRALKGLINNVEYRENIIEPRVRLKLHNYICNGCTFNE